MNPVATENLGKKHGGSCIALHKSTPFVLPVEHKEGQSC